MLYHVDRRCAPRQPRQELLFVQISVAAPHAPRNTIRCRSADISGNGLRVTLDEALVRGAEVDMWIRLDDLARNFLLRGRVRWSDPERGGAGIAIMHAEGTDFWEWQALATG